jgi:hypothetical protein
MSACPWSRIERDGIQKASRTVIVLPRPNAVTNPTRRLCPSGAKGVHDVSGGPNYVIDTNALTRDSFWQTFVDDLVTGDFATQDIASGGAA